MVQWLRLYTPSAEGLGSTPGQGTRSHKLPFLKDLKGGVGRWPCGPKAVVLPSDPEETRVRSLHRSATALLTPPSFPERLTDTRSPEEAKKCKNGTESETFRRKAFGKTNTIL